MGSKLNQLVRSSYTGNIDNWAEVDKIVTKFVNSSLAEILDTVNTGVKKMIETLAGCLLTEEWGLSNEHAESMKYTELLCLIDNTKIDPTKEQDDEWPVYECMDVKLPRPSFRYLGVSDVYFLLKAAEKTNNSIKLFLSINVNTFIAYLESVSHSSKLVRVWGRLRQRAEALKIKIGPDTSIGGILDQAEKSRGNWTPWTRIGDYYNKTLFIFDVYSSLLIDCFRCAYPEKFGLQNIIDQYRQEEMDDQK